MTTVHDFTETTIDGAKRPLSEYAGKVLLVVNVASKCGLTPQYEGLEKLHETYGPKGLRVLGFPANEFGKQEPGSNDEIQTFCTTNYGVKFDMFSKVVVKGPGIDPLYAHLVKETGGADVAWNFGKFLVGKGGEVLERFEPTVAPDDPKLVAAIERALASPAGA